MASRDPLESGEPSQRHDHQCRLAALSYSGPRAWSPPRRCRTYTAVDGVPAALAASFIVLAYRDYVAARHLLIGDHCLAGAVMASTAVEKYFKCMLFIFGEEPRGHLSPAMIEPIKRRDPGLLATSNEEFVAFLERVYRTRYFDDLEPGFSVVVPKRKVLAELDELVHKVERRVVVHQFEPTTPTKRSYQIAIEERDPAVLLGNHVLLGESKTSFIEQRDVVVELRIFPHGQPFEAQYITAGVRNDGTFLWEGLTPVGTDGRSFNLRYEPELGPHEPS